MSDLYRLKSSITYFTNVLQWLKRYTNYYILFGEMPIMNLALL